MGLSLGPVDAGILGMLGWVCKEQCRWKCDDSNKPLVFKDALTRVSRGGGGGGGVISPLPTCGREQLWGHPGMGPYKTRSRCRRGWDAEPERDFFFYSPLFQQEQKYHEHVTADFL